jgi:hypothetical protein
MLKTRVQNPKWFMMAGMTFLVLSSAWPRFIPFGAGMSEDRLDFVKGLLIGLSIGFNMLFVIIQSRRKKV